MTIFYFSATGNSLAVAKQIGGNLISIPQIIGAKQSQYRDDVIGVVFPIYISAPPKMVQAFLQNVKLEADYTFSIGTYGKMHGACMVNLQKMAKEHGYRFDYANHILMLDNYLPGFEMKEEIENLPAKNVNKKLEEIKADIKARKHMQASASLGMRLFTALVSNMPPNGKAAQGYIVNDKCTKCGVCASVCPAQNIDVQKSAVSFSDHCEVCYACVHLCPQNAIHLKNEKSGKRWRNPDVSVKEIINANNRMKIKK